MPRCTCCDGIARKQCEDHDTGYGVCDACLEKYGREEFCHIPSCKAHLPEVRKETYGSDKKTVEDQRIYQL